MNNETTENILGALGGNAAGADNGGAPDYKALYEEAQKQLQTEKVEAGRLKQEVEKNAALRKELDELKKAKQAEDVISALPDDLKAEVPDDFKRGSALIAQKAAEMAVAGQNERLARLEQEREEEKKRKAQAAQAEMLKRIDETFPGFGKSVLAGGDKHDAWNKYLVRNAPSVVKALNDADFDTMKYHVEMFFKGLELPLPSGSQDGSAAPDPRSMGGGVESQTVVLQPGKTYTANEYKRILDDAQGKFQRHLLSYKEYVGICEELSKAYKEGRVK